MDQAEIVRLLDAAKKVTGSDAATARAISATFQRVSNWRHGREPVPPGDVVLLADTAGLDPVAWAARAVMQPYAGTEKGEKLEKALKRALAVTGGAMLSVGLDAAVRAIEFHTMYRLVKSKPHLPRRILDCADVSVGSMRRVDLLRRSEAL